MTILQISMYLIVIVLISCLIKWEAKQPKDMFDTSYYLHGYFENS